MSSWAILDLFTNTKAFNADLVLFMKSCGALYACRFIDMSIFLILFTMDFMWVFIHTYSPGLYFVKALEIWTYLADHVPLQCLHFERLKLCNYLHSIYLLIYYVFDRIFYYIIRPPDLFTLLIVIKDNISVYSEGFSQESILLLISIHSFHIHAYENKNVVNTLKIFRY